MEPEGADLVRILNVLADIYRNQSKYADAEPLLLRAQAICEKKTTNADLLSFALTLYNLVSLYTDQRKHKQAEPLGQRMLEIVESQEGPTHPETAKALLMVADIFRHLGNLSEAIHYCERAFIIFKDTYGLDAAPALSPLSSLAALYHEQGRYDEAENLFKQALSLADAKLGPDHLDKASVQLSYALLLWDTQRYEEAEELEEKALQIKRLWLEKTAPLELFKAEYAAIKRKYLREGKEVMYDGKKMTGKEFFAIWVHQAEETFKAFAATSETSQKEPEADD